MKAGSTVPIGYLWTVAVLALGTVLALAPVRLPGILGALSFRLGLLVSELPFVAFGLLLASTVVAVGQRDISSAAGRVVLGAAVLTAVGLAVVAWLGLRARPAVDRALREGLGAGWRAAVDAGMAGRLRRRRPYARILVRPFFVRRHDVERVADLSYGAAGKLNLLDIYRRRSGPTSGPTLVYFHGGGYGGGRKDREARPLLYRLASQGWVCVSANYRLRPAATFADHLVDVKRVLAWVRAHGHQYGADPRLVFVAGSSAGGHLAALAALTPNDPTFQPGFEDADTSVTAAICLYGYYGPYYGHGADERPASAPLAYLRPDAPPFFVAHGDRDEYPATSVGSARLFVQKVRSASSEPVVYAELPGGHHGFDFFHSLRFEAVVDGIEAFAAWVRSREKRSAEA
jgi:acetyl esterase/lipase